MTAARMLGMFVIVATASACGADPEENPVESTPIAVQTAEVQRGRVAAEIDAGGTVRGRKTAIISSRIVSSIVDVRVRPGDRVRAGAILLRLDARQADAAAARAQASLSAVRESVAAVDAESDAAAAALTLARTEHARMATLHERSVATVAELETVTAALRSAEARARAVAARRAEVAQAVEAARAGATAATVDASYTTIAAPFDGVITDKTAEPGGLAMPGAPLLTLEDIRQYRLEISVDASQAPGVATGSRVTVTVAGLDPLEGIVDEVAAVVNPHTHAYDVKILLPPSAALRSGLYGTARLATPAGDDRVIVPRSAIVRRGRLTFVFADDRGTARLRFVHTGAAAADTVPVLSGLVPGDRVVIDPPANLSDGARLATARAGSATGRAQ